ncbi:MAG: CYTH domain-containing protein [Longicatena sp.]
MNENIELEYKVLLNENQFEKLTSRYPSLKFKKQVNTYYDTKDMQIRTKKGAMRIREIDDTCIFTLKMHKGNDLLEYECKVPENSTKALSSEEIISLLNKYELSGPFHVLTSLTTYRAMIITEYAEICFDKNHYGNNVDYEIEYEYKKDHDGLKEFQTILDFIGVTYTQNCDSKIKRALDQLL